MMKIDLRMKATILVGIISYMMQNPKSLYIIENLFGSQVDIRDSEGRLTLNGKRLHSLTFMLITYMTMSYRRK